MEVNLLHHLADLVARARDPEKIYAAAVDAVLAAAKADRASILVFDDAGVMRFRAWHGLSDGYRAAVEGHSPWSRDDTDPVPIVVPDVKADASLESLRHIIDSEGIRALAFIPLVHRGRLLGKFMVYYNAPHDFSDRELNAAAIVALQVAFTLEHARTDAAMTKLLERERAARRDAEAANRAKDRFLAVLSHELRNPLAPILFAAGIMQQIPAADSRLRHAAEVTERQAQHLARLLDDLLNVARITLGKIELRREVVDLGAVVHEAAEVGRQSAASQGHQLTVAVPEPAVRVLADRTRLVQIVGNLLDNAVKYTPRGGRISIEAAREGDEAVIRVRDTGAGIPAELLQRIFEPFMQGDPSAAQSHGGLGIGLALVRSLVELHGGRVQAVSEGPGRGAEFVVHLPVARAAETFPRQSDQPSRRRPRRVLIIEDNVDAREMLRTALEMADHQVEDAPGGELGVPKALEVRPDVVIIDIGLPGLDGYEVARRIRAELGAAVRLIALTGYGRPEDKRRAEQAGFDAHLVKPVEPDELVAKIDRLTLA